MITVTETALLDQDPETLWRQVGSFGSVGQWHPMIAKVTTNGEGLGAVRRLEMREGGIQLERLQMIDPSLHLYRYSLQQAAIPIINFTAEFHIEGADKRGSVITWSARFDVVSGSEKQGAQTVCTFFRAGLQRLCAMYDPSGKG
jgi:hypothetical protein